jgi:internalin A
MTPRPEYVFEDDRAGRTLVVTGSWSASAAEALANGEADGLNLNYARGFVGGDLEFLDGRLGVRRLKLLDRGVADLGPIARLASSLEELSVQAAADAEVDLAALPRLRVVAGEWSVIRNTLSGVEYLESVSTWRFDEHDLHAFRDHFGLRRLTIKEAPYLESLSGIEDLHELSVLDVVLARKLSDLSDVAAISSSLRQFKLESCRAVSSLDDIEDLRELRVLGFSNCGDIASIVPLRSLAQLEELYAWGTTRIIDGDLSPLNQLPHLREIRMKDRRGYRPSLAELMSTLRP